ncbi:hypothetical protein [Mesorhizobium sp. B2-1-2]|uniref:hypothetical protein n=1 Tax=Mesorhizobium sp. B2-1-2 TaxID=2589973 RepID=UPI001129D455|nr:hypothetical protein [Mesorhizobium sp. B2-1-2]TPN04483.1 hypothetical protein FJ971_29500 [Mesorhizobium sp. B2-1-2]
MSLEAALAEHTAALKESTAVNSALLAATKDLLSLRNDAIDKVSAAVGATGKGKDKKEDAGKKDDDKKGEDAGKGQISTNPENRVNPYEGVKDKIAAYITGTDRPEERDARKEKVKKLLNHEQIKKADVATATAADHIMEDAVPKFMSNMDKFIAAGDLTEAPKKPASDDLDI